PDCEASEGSAVGDLVWCGRSELATVGQDDMNHLAAWRIQPTRHLQDDRNDWPAVGRSRPHLHSDCNLGGENRTGWRRDDRVGREADWTPTQSRTLKNLIDMTQQIDFADNLVTQGFGGRAGEHVEAVNGSIPLQSYRVELQPVPIYRDDLIIGQGSWREVLAPDDRRVGWQIRNDVRILPVRVRAWVRHTPTSTDEGFADIVDDAEFEIRNRPRHERQYWNDIETKGPKHHQDRKSVV